MKKSTCQKLFIFVLVSIISLPIQAQTYVYEAFINDKKVGQMTAYREVNDESEKISVTSYIDAHIFAKARTDFESHSTYIDGRLVEAEAISKTNGHIYSKATTILKNGKYQAQVDKKLVSIEHEKIIGGDLFYFEEPINIDNVYMLATGQMLNVESSSEHEFYFEHNGKKELHKYVDGVLNEMRLEHKLYTVIFKLQN